MISPKKLIKLARKWQNMVALRRKRITFPRSSGDIDADSCNTSSLAEKGHFVVYSAYQRRFILPLEYLKNQIVKELFQLAEDEWGLQGNGLLTLPCDAVFMEYLIALIKRHATEDVQGALLMSMTSTRCSSCSYHHQEAKWQQLPSSSF